MHDAVAIKILNYYYSTCHCGWKESESRTGSNLSRSEESISLLESISRNLESNNILLHPSNNGKQSECIPYTLDYQEEL